MLLDHCTSVTGKLEKSHLLICHLYGCCIYVPCTIRKCLEASQEDVLILQEGFGLSSLPILRRRGTGRNVVSSKQVVADEVCALNRQYSAGLVTDSLDHRARACY